MDDRVERSEGDLSRLEHQRQLALEQDEHVDRVGGVHAVVLAVVDRDGLPAGEQVHDRRRGNRTIVRGHLVELRLGWELHDHEAHAAAAHRSESRQVSLVRGKANRI